MENYDPVATLAKQYSYCFLLILTLIYPLRTDAKVKLNNKTGPTIILDAGHGGEDSGARGINIEEKDVTLAICQKLKLLLIGNLPGSNVLLTRESDQFVALKDRSSYSNLNRADIFVSVHCNSSPNKHGNRRGSETYVMGLHKSKENIAVAARENAVVEMESTFHDNYTNLNPDEPEGFIILNQYHSIYLNESIELAKLCENEFSIRHPGGSGGVKQAGFHVLYQVNCPSILIETGFVNNSKDELYLMSEEGQWEIANNIALAIGNYFEKKTKTQDYFVEQVSSKQTEPQNIYRIQLASSYKQRMKLEDNPLWQHVKTPEIIKENELFKYYVGQYSDKGEAKLEQERLQAMGFKDAIVVSMQLSN